MSTIDDLERKVQSLKDRLQSAEQSLEAAMIAACPIKVGDVVVTISGNERRRVTRLEAKYSSVHLYGTKLKTNGEWGGRESYIGIAREGDGCYGWFVEGRP